MHLVYPFKIFSLAVIDRAGIELWYKRLVRVPSKVLSYLFPAQKSYIEDIMKKCFVYPCAR